MSRKNSLFRIFAGLWRPLVAIVVSFPLAFQAFADGTETLGTPSISIASGSGIVAAGTGMVSQPGTIDISVPAGATVNQVLLYWEGQMNTDVPGDDTIVVDGNSVTGSLIGGETFFARDIYSSAFRADITGLGLVSAGTNTLTVDGLDFSKVANGAGVLVIFDDGSGFAEIDVRDGLDLAFIRLDEPQKSTIPQTITFAPAALDRVADFDLFFSSVAGNVSGADADRPTSIEVTVGGTTTVFSNELASLDGEEWDTVNVGFDIPAGASSLTVQAFSRDDNNTGNLPASFAWITAALSIQPPAALGDRVWEDLNANGIQDCEDSNGNGIIGDAGDTGTECDAGIPEVPVSLLAGDCQTSLGQTVMTDNNGFYLFPNLDPDDYCVEFGKPSADFCDTDGFDLGEPQFTTQNAGNDDAIDSDADTETGVSGPVSLAAGENNLTFDAGIYCPAKIGDRVWSDDNGNGIQDDGPEGVEGVKVTLFECGNDMVAGTADDVDTGQMRNTGTDGMYMFGAEPDFTLYPGKYFVQFMKPDGTQFTVPNVNGDDINSDCMSPDGTTACTKLGSRGINLNRDCGLIPPPSAECDLELDKKCRVEVPPVTGDLACEAKIAATVLEYIGSGTPVAVTVEGKNKKATVAANFDPNTGLLTIDARPEDLGAKMTITTDGVAEVIHTSCSTPYVAGQPAPLDNPKGGPSANWLVLSFVDKEGGSASIPDDGNNGDGDGDGVFTDNCTLTEPSQKVTYQYVVTNNGDPLTGILVTDSLLGDIGTIPALGRGDSDTLTTTARISGTTVNTGTASALLDGDVCSASDRTTVFEPPPVAGGECDGKVTDLTLKNLGTSAQVRVEQKKDGDTVFDDFVAEGGEFSFSGTDKKGTLSTEISIFVDGILNTKIHTSCSKPIGPGLVSGSFEVISGNSRNGGPLPPL